MSKNKDMGFGMRVGSELVAGLIVGVGMGWLLDYAFETKPLFIIIFFILGGIAGILNVMRAANAHFKQSDQKKDPEIKDPEIKDYRDLEL